MSELNEEPPGPRSSNLLKAADPSFQMKSTFYAPSPTPVTSSPCRRRARRAGGSEQGRQWTGGAAAALGQASVFFC